MRLWHDMEIEAQSPSGKVNNNPPKYMSAHQDASLL